MSGLNTDPERFYFVSNNRLAIVEKNGTTTVDNATTVFKTITEAKSLRIHGIFRAAHFNTGTSVNTSDLTSSVLGPLGDIPVQFHEALVYKVISMGYKTPPNLQIELAQYFDMEYAASVKEAKKYSKSSFVGTGFISPVDF